MMRLPFLVNRPEAPRQLSSEKAPAVASGRPGRLGMRAIWERIKNEPVLAWQIVAAIISLAGSFGCQLTAEQTAAAFGVCQVLAALAGRQLVTPVRKIDDRPRPARLHPDLGRRR